MSLYRTKPVEQSICYFNATVDGRMPSQPSKYLGNMAKQIETLTTGWPGETWKAYEIVYPIQVDRFNGDVTVSDMPVVKGVSRELSDSLLNQIKTRYGMQWADPKRYEALKSRGSDLVV